LKDHHPTKVSVQQKQDITTANAASWNNSRTAFVYAKDGDIYFTDIKKGTTKQVLQTTEKESNPQFSFDDRKIVYSSNQNLYAWDIATGETTQLTNLQAQSSTSQSQQGRGNGVRGRGGEANMDSVQEDWLKKDQLQYLVVLKERKEKKEATDAYNKSMKKELREINITDRILQGLGISPD
ncbi:MAG TPA: DPP IV N-terminal domain-containing protein, partial [Chitinophagaceae bacterium]